MFLLLYFQLCVCMGGICALMSRLQRAGEGYHPLRVGIKGSIALPMGV